MSLSVDSTDYDPLFYVYVRHNASDTTYVGVFPSRSVADEWWRAVSTCRNDVIRESIRRVRPQFYTQKSASDVSATLTDSQCAPQFRDRVSFTLVGSIAFTPIPVDTSRDLISGQSFYIRSKSNPAEHWHNGSDGLGISTTGRTLFRISRTEPGSEEGSVMIGSDEVAVVATLSNKPLLMLPHDPRHLYRDGVLTLDWGDDVSKLHFRLEFLLRSFIFVEKTVSSQPGDDTIKTTLKLHPKRQAGLGEAWELV